MNDVRRERRQAHRHIRRAAGLGRAVAHPLPGLRVDRLAGANLEPAAFEVDHDRALEHHLHHPVQSFAYPAGKFNEHSEELARQAGYVLAVTTRPGATQDARAPFALHRYEVLDTTGVRGLAALLAG